jgi:hypothetical protein
VDNESQKRCAKKRKVEGDSTSTGNCSFAVGEMHSPTLKNPDAFNECCVPCSEAVDQDLEGMRMR